MVAQLDAASIARFSIHDPANFSLQESQTLHRLVLLQHWNIKTGSKILELGCGQGDCTAVLASAVGEEGKVIAVDPAELDYGTPFGFSYSSAYSDGVRERQPTDSSFRCTIYPRPSTGSSLARPAWQADHLGSTVPLGLPLLPPLLREQCLRCNSACPLPMVFRITLAHTCHLPSSQEAQQASTPC